MALTLHLMLLRSGRGCCERCGLKLIGQPDSFWDRSAWVPDQKLYRRRPADPTTAAQELVPCTATKRKVA